MLRRLAALGGRQFLRLRPVKTPEDVSDFGYEQTELEDYLGYYDRYGDYTDEVNKSKKIVIFGEAESPMIANDAFVAPNAVIAGNVEVWNRASIWYRVVIKSEKNLVRIGFCSNVQDGTIIEEAPTELGYDHDGSTIIGHYVTIGHDCVLRACTVENTCLVGMGSVLCEGSYMEHGSILGARSVLRPFQRIPSHQVWVGNPAKYLRDVTEEEMAMFEKSAANYFKTAQEHAETFYLEPQMDLYNEAEAKGICIGIAENPAVLNKYQRTRSALKKSLEPLKKE